MALSDFIGDDNNVNLSKLSAFLKQRMGGADAPADRPEDQESKPSPAVDSDAEQPSPQASAAQANSAIKAPASGAAQASPASSALSQNQDVLNKVLGRLSDGSQKPSAADQGRSELIKSFLDKANREPSSTTEKLELGGMGALSALLGGVIGGWKGAAGGAAAGNQVVQSTLEKEQKKQELAQAAKAALMKEALGKELELDNKRQTIPLENEGKLASALGQAALLGGNKISLQDMKDTAANARQLVGNEFKGGQNDQDRALKASEGSANRDNKVQTTQMGVDAKKYAADQMAKGRNVSNYLRERGLGLREDQMAAGAADKLDKDPVLKDLVTRRQQIGIDKHTLESSDTITPQMAGELEAGIAAALGGSKGATVHSSEMQEMNTLQRDAAKFKQYLSANPQDAVSPEIRQQYENLLDRLDGSYRIALRARAESVGAGRSYAHSPQAQKVISDKVSSYSAPANDAAAKPKAAAAPAAPIDPTKMSREDKIKLLMGN